MPDSTPTTSFDTETTPQPSQPPSSPQPTLPQTEESPAIVITELMALNTAGIRDSEGIESVNVMRMRNALARTMRMRLNDGNIVRLKVCVKLVKVDIKNILAELQKLTCHTVKEIVILMEAELDREKNCQTKLFTLLLGFKI